ncbi:adipocyte plasma membrane-associated protein [Harpegnathos saltator]|uniref:Adipocyte plasma membrane-associated protein n=1 Tax=Harpegnathos saltator TaxID=610380 RepID=E2BAW5_HARSA|nr:adipocyte plasma membrane-associated protein [Harpegnathos saltator]EFN87172.1 Adipocyte plasma membrane-associated protein [Harpegnathos saltator]
MSYLKSIGTFVIYVGVFLALITFLPGLPPHVEFDEYSIVLPHVVDAKVGPKIRLRGAQRIYVGEVVGPESFDSYNGELYSGVYGGYIIRLEENRVVPIVKFGKKCDGIWQEHICGRPLGFKFDKKGNLYVMDCYYGLFKVDISTKEYKNLVNITKSIDGKKPMLPNSIDVAENGDLYWTDSNTDFPLYEGFHISLANPSGRLLRYNAANKKNEVLLRDLGFANGVKLSDDESFVIIAETLKSRIMKYHLKGPKSGQFEIFVEGLPGLPDNIHSDGHGGFLITTIISSSPEHPILLHSLIPHPLIRKMLSRLLFLIEMPFELIYHYYPNTNVEKIMHWIGSFPMITEMVIDSMKKSMIIRLDSSGNILEVLSSDETDIVNGISSAYIHNNYLWLGSPWNNHVLRIPLKQAFPDLAVDGGKVSSRVQSEKQLPKAVASNANTERVKRDTGSAATAKPIESKATSKKVATQATHKPSTAPVTPTPTTPISTAAPTTSKPTIAPKTASKAEKPATSGNVKSQENKPQVSKSANAEIKNNAKTDTKLHSPNVKPETNDKTRENTAKTNTKSEKNLKIEPDASAKTQKVNPRK